MIVSQLCVYPLKSGREIKLQQARVNFPGLLNDREMMLVSGNGKFITQRQFPQLAKVQTGITDRDLTFQLTDGSFSPITITPILDGRLTEVKIWSDRLMAVDQGDEVAGWFHQLLNLPTNKACRLVRRSSSHPRLLNKKHLKDADRPLNFADNSPVMLTATASLDELNQRIAEMHLSLNQTIPMSRFRPNIVIETIEPFIEDTWSVVQIGDVKFKMVKPSSRCIVTTIEQQQGEKNQFKEPLNTLGTFRQLSEYGVMFGVNMTPDNQGMIKKGDRLRVLQTRN